MCSPDDRVVLSTGTASFFLLTMLARAAILEEEEEEEEGTSNSSLEELGLWGDRGRRRMAAEEHVYIKK